MSKILILKANHNKLHGCEKKHRAVYDVKDTNFESKSQQEFAFIGQKVHSNLTNALLLSCPGLTASHLLHEKDNIGSADVKNRLKALTSGMSEDEIEDWRLYI